MSSQTTIQQFQSPSGTQTRGIENSTFGTKIWDFVDQVKQQSPIQLKAVRPDPFQTVIVTAGSKIALKFARKYVKIGKKEDKKASLFNWKKILFDVALVGGYVYVIERTMWLALPANINNEIFIRLFKIIGLSLLEYGFKLVVKGSDKKKPIVDYLMEWGLVELIVTGYDMMIGSLTLPSIFGKSEVMRNN